MHRRLILGSALLLLIGCGGSDAGDSDEGSESAGGEHTEGHHHGHHGEEHHHEGGHSHRMNADLSAFHDVLAPVWHGEPGAGRAEQACLNAERFNQLSEAADAAILEGVAEDDPARAELPTSAIHDAALHLTDVCGDDDQPDTASVEAALSSLHDAFEAAMHSWQEHNAG